MLRVSVEHLLQSLQVGWCIFYGYFAFASFQQVSTGRDADLDCFHDLGAYKICAVTQNLSISVSVLLLMTQALVSRMIVPGISNFVNASVRRLHPRACGSMTMVFVICGARWPHALQVLHSGSNGGTGETSGAEADDDDERSKRAVMMAPA